MFNMSFSVWLNEVKLNGRISGGLSYIKCIGIWKKWENVYYFMFSIKVFVRLNEAKPYGEILGGSS